MKKDLLLYLSIITLLIISIFINTNNKKDIKNMFIIDENINIIYPYFNNNKIDSTIKNYLDEILKSTCCNNKLNIDYDYYMYEEGINITFFKQEITNNIVNDYMEIIDYNYDEDIVSKSSKKVSNEEYDVINNKVIDKDKPMVAFTFDDGPNYNTKKIIDILNKYNVRATFFVIGKNALRHKNIIKYMAESGMDIGNHTYSHKELTKYKENIIIDEIEKTKDVIKDITGTYPTFLRPSYGSTNKKVKEIANMPIVIWNLDTKDWRRHNSDYIVNRIINNIDDGDIILMHDIYSATMNAVKKVIPILLEMDYQIVSVKELFYYKDKNYIDGKVYASIR